MNVSELARKLRTTTDELLAKLPELGFDIGKRAIKVDDRVASRIVQAWNSYKIQEAQKQDYLRAKEHQAATREGAQLSGEKVQIPAVLSVRELAEILKTPVSQVIGTLMKNGVIASLNQKIDYETAAIVAEEMGFPAEQTTANADDQVFVSQIEKMDKVLAADTGKLSRPPIVVVMGHVDHGKTKLLDAIRKTHVMEGEAGGITQHIGAYQVVWKDKNKNEQKISFIDTPGHEAFTAMRSRGAEVADIAILVIAADDGVMPQTIEAIKIAEAAKLPIIVAINKIDKPGADPEKIKRELSQQNLISEDWGGKTIMIPISAKQNQNIDAVLDAILLVAGMEVATIQANPDGKIMACVIESHIDKNSGPVATLLVKNGTLRVADILHIDGVFVGKVKTLKDWLGKELKEVEPSCPAQILGFKIAPKVGDIVEVAAEMGDVTRVKFRKSEKQESAGVDESSQTEDKEGVTKVNLILRADVLGSLEAIVESLKKLEREDLKIKIVKQGLGNLTENDVALAEASKAIVFGFNVRFGRGVEEALKAKNITVKLHRIIYDLIDDVKEKINELVKPETVRLDLGKVEVLVIFKKTAGQMVIGGKVVDGEIVQGAKAAVLRQGNFITTGDIEKLQAAKQDVTNCVRGQECGVQFRGQPLIEKGDILEVFREEAKKHGI
ncbi:MAG: translation initiation factor IF-2 [Candidatus Falkowbacteria bacterium]